MEHNQSNEKAGRWPVSTVLAHAWRLAQQHSTCTAAVQEKIIIYIPLSGVARIYACREVIWRYGNELTAFGGRSAAPRPRLAAITRGKARSEKLCGAC